MRHIFKTFKYNRIYEIIAGKYGLLVAASLPNGSGSHGGC